MAIPETSEIEKILVRMSELVKKPNSCKRCKGAHIISVNLPTRSSMWCKGCIDLGVFLTVPCHTCHPVFFRRFLREVIRIRPDIVYNKDKVTKR